MSLDGPSVDRAGQELFWRLRVERARRHGDQEEPQKQKPARADELAALRSAQERTDPAPLRRAS
jgi:hypothetical protein